MHSGLQGLLFRSEGISSIEIFICKSCCNCLLNNDMPKLALTNGLWIGIARYHCWTIWIKLSYSNKGGKIHQHALKGNVVNFSQDPKNVVKLLDILPLSLESLSDIDAIHFVGNTHPPIEFVKMCKLLYGSKFAIFTWLNWLKFIHVG
jgi:hypothetical protein